MKTKDKIIFLTIVFVLFLVDIGSKRLVFDHFSVVITDTPPQEMWVLYNKQKPFVCVPPSYEPLELIKSYNTFTFDTKYRSELDERSAKPTLRKIFSKHNYDLGKNTHIVFKGDKKWLLYDWQNGKRFLLSAKKTTLR